MNKVTINTADIIDLLDGASVAVSKDKALSNYAAVWLSATNGLVTARATDRFRAISGTVLVDHSPESESVAMSEIALSPAAIKQIKAMAAAYKLRGKYNGESCLEYNPDTNALTVTISGDSATIRLEELRAPNSFDSIIPTELTAVDRIGINPELFGSFAKVPTSLSSPTFAVSFAGERKPVTVEIPHDSIKWIVLVMPCRVSDRVTAEKVSA